MVKKVHGSVKSFGPQQGYLFEAMVGMENMIEAQ
jgi:hypothetical protein